MEEETDFESDGEDLNEIFELFQLNDANLFVTNANIGYWICFRESSIKDFDPQN